MADNLDNYLVDITIPSLSSSNYAADIAQMAQDIDDNFKKIISAPFMQGDPGESIKIITKPLYEDPITGAFTELGRLVIAYIYEKYEEYGLVIDDIYTYDDLCTALSNPDIEGDFDDNLSCRFLAPGAGNDVIECNEIQGYIVFNAPYFFTDSRTVDGVWNFMYDTDKREHFIDMSCTLFGVCEDADNDVWDVQRYYIMPTLYWNDDLGMFCWKVNDQYTNVTAQGIKGDAGDMGHIYITRGTLHTIDSDYDDTVPFEIDLSDVWSYVNGIWQWEPITPDPELFKNSIVGVWFTPAPSSSQDTEDTNDLSFTFAVPHYESDGWHAYYGQTPDNGGTNCDIRAIINSLKLHSMLDEVGVRRGNNPSNVPSRVRALYVRDTINDAQATGDEITHAFGMEENIIESAQITHRGWDRDNTKVLALAPVTHEHVLCEEIVPPDNSGFEKERITNIDRLLRIYYNTEIMGDTTLLGTTTISGQVNLGGDVNNSAIEVTDGNVEVNAPTIINQNVTIGGRLIKTIQVPDDYTLTPCLLVRPHIVFDDAPYSIVDNWSVFYCSTYLDVFTCLKYTKKEDEFNSKNAKYLFIKRYETFNVQKKCMFWTFPYNDHIGDPGDPTFLKSHTALLGIKNPWGNGYMFLSLNGCLFTPKIYNIGLECFVKDNPDDIVEGNILYFNSQQNYNNRYSITSPYANYLSDTCLKYEIEDGTTTPILNSEERLYEFSFPLDTSGNWHPDKKITATYSNPDIWYNGAFYADNGYNDESSTSYNFDITKNFNNPVIYTRNGHTYIDIYSYVTDVYKDNQNYETVYPNVMLGTTPVEDADTKGYMALMTRSDEVYNRLPTQYKYSGVNEATRNCRITLQETNKRFFFDAPATIDLTDFRYAGDDYLFPYLFGGVLNRRNALPLMVDSQHNPTPDDVYEELHSDDKYTITIGKTGDYDNNCHVVQNNSAAASCSYATGTNVTLRVYFTSLPPTRKFVQWNDGNTDNPRIVTVTSNATYTAEFAHLDSVTIGDRFNYDNTHSSASFTVNGQSINPDEPIQEGTPVEITITPNTGYGFAYYNINEGGNIRQVTENPYTVRMYNNMYIDAVVSPLCTITVTSSDISMGTVTGSDDYPQGTYATITATPEPGYVFSSWNDGNTEAERTVYVSSSRTYIANFVPAYTLTVESADDTLGTAAGGGEYALGDTATLTATPAEGCRFQMWLEDSSTDNPHTVTVTGDATYTAKFEVIPSYTITVQSDDTSKGVVAGSGAYLDGSTVTITALPLAGYGFVQWNDGNTEAVREVTVTGNATYTAYFDTEYLITVGIISGQEDRGTVSGGGYYVSGATANISATSNTGYAFYKWSDDDTDNPREVTVTGDERYDAAFEPTATITLLSNDDTKGAVFGGGDHIIGTTVQVKAEAAAGCSFVTWDDGDTSNPRYITVTGPATYTAMFA